MTYDSVLAFVKSHFPEREQEHALCAERFVCELFESAPVALRIAALCHDIDRSFPEWRTDTGVLDYERAKGIHAGMSASLFAFLRLVDDESLVHDVCFLMTRHEHGPIEEKPIMDLYTKSFDLVYAAQILWYADKLTFFAIEIESYAKRGQEALEKKIAFSLKGLPEDIKQRAIDESPEQFRPLVKSLM